MQVEEKLVADFNYVAGVTTVLTNQLQQVGTCTAGNKNMKSGVEGIW